MCHLFILKPDFAWKLEAIASEKSWSSLSAPGDSPLLQSEYEYDLPSSPDSPLLQSEYEYDLPCQAQGLGYDGFGNRR